jgi:hypothetical protein
MATLTTETSDHAPAQPNGHRLPRTAARLLAGLAAAAAAVVMVGTAAMVVLCWNPLPYWDQWDNLIAGRDVTLAWLVSQHNEHRILVPRLIFLADARLFDERNVLELVANGLVPLATACLLSLLAGRTMRLGRSGSVIVASLSCALMFSALQWENFVSPFQVQVFLVCFAGPAACLVHCCGRPHGPTLLAVIVLEILAALSMASGIVVPMIIVALGLRLHRPAWQIALLTITGCLMLALYLWGYVTPSQHEDPAAAFADPLGIAAYVIGELGVFPQALFGHATLWIHRVSGGIALSLFAALLVSHRRGVDGAAQAEAALLGIGSFALGTCVLTALGRARFGVEQAASGRYATLVLLFWAVLLLLGLARLPERRRAAGLFAMSLFTLVLACVEPRLAAPAIRAMRSLRAAEPAVLVPDGDAEMLSRLYPVPGVIAARLPSLRAAAASVFEDPWSGRLQTMFRMDQARATVPGCKGDVSEVLAVGDGKTAGWRLTGHLSVPAWPAARLVLVDLDDRVVGLGRAGLDGRAIGEPSASAGRAPDRWLGEAITTDPNHLRIYALDAQDHPFCSLGAPADPHQR